MFEGFSKLDRAQRLRRLLEMQLIEEADINYLNQSVSPELIEIADRLIENVIGCFPMPLGIATHFCIDDHNFLIPMAVEETSIIAAASRTAKWLRASGAIRTWTKGTQIIGQIQLPRLKNPHHFAGLIEAHQHAWIKAVNEKVVPNLVRRGGGVDALQVRLLPRGDGDMMGVIHVLLNPCDAMGANLMTQVCEYLKEPIQTITQEKVAMCILSNLTDTKLSCVEIRIPNIDPQLGEAISEASLFAECDPYRAATHNKGILNGIDAVLIATGNDWRAVESAIHAYAARNGSYSAVSQWHMNEGCLIGRMEIPIAVGTVGGVTRIHPTAQLCLKLLDVQDANHLARIIAAVGLVQNLGALRALVTEGIMAGHMKLHVTNLLMAAGAAQKEMLPAKSILEKILLQQKKITVKDAEWVLDELRQTT